MKKKKFKFNERKTWSILKYFYFYKPMKLNNDVLNEKSNAFLTFITIVKTQ
jgi:hypothetical protein